MKYDSFLLNILNFKQKTGRKILLSYLLPRSLNLRLFFSRVLMIERSTLSRLWGTPAQSLWRSNLSRVASHVLAKYSIIISFVSPLTSMHHRVFRLSVYIINSLFIFQSHPTIKIEGRKTIRTFAKNLIYSKFK